MGPEQIAVALELLGEEQRATQEARDRVELVWTDAPERRAPGARTTSAVVRSLFETAERSVIVFGAMEAAQWPAARKRAAADRVIWNSGSLEALERDARRVWDAISAAGEQEACGSGGRDAKKEWQVDLHMRFHLAPVPEHGHRGAGPGSAGPGLAAAALVHPEGDVAGPDPLDEPHVRLLGERGVGLDGRAEFA